MFYELGRYYADKKNIIRKLFIHPYVLFILPVLPYFLSRMYWSELSHLARGTLFFGSILVPIGAISLGSEMVKSDSSEVRRGGYVLRFSAIALFVCVFLSNGISQKSDDNLFLMFIAFIAGYALKGFENFERREANNALLEIAQRVRQSSKIIQDYGELLERPGPLLRKESDLSVDKKQLRIKLAEALLRPDLNEQMKNGLSIAFASLEFFLQKQEFETVGAAHRFMGDSEILDLLSRGKRGDNISVELGALAHKIVDDRGDETVWHRVVKRYSERVYQAAVLKNIAAGDADPDLANLIAKVDAEVDNASLALKARNTQQS